LWPFVAGSLAALGACSASADERARPGPTAIEQAHAVYSALVAAQVVHNGVPEAVLPPPPTPVRNLYEVGAEGFFLDRAEAIGLSADVIAALTSIKEQASLVHQAIQQEIDAAEKRLRTLTFEPAPDPAKIDAEIVEIGRLRIHQRMADARAVGLAIAVVAPVLPPPARPM